MFHIPKSGYIDIKDNQQFKKNFCCFSLLENNELLIQVYKCIITAPFFGTWYHKIIPQVVFIDSFDSRLSLNCVGARTAFSTKFDFEIKEIK
ncbi:hypothetical protein BpHYR1_013416 [Brachionus plicatilis]|uniref:Uncharacterized protein n=1 Tax=Brachionus plicatilis TaxID=10195 RepID=A0A3M7PXG4_BRAPC|nr:hypothetical protein BpHYR1_013416 [Brachionus plicatilis]